MYQVKNYYLPWRTWKLPATFQNICKSPLLHPQPPIPEPYIFLNMSNMCICEQSHKHFQHNMQLILCKYGSRSEQADVDQWSDTSCKSMLLCTSYPLSTASLGRPPDDAWHHLYQSRCILEKEWPPPLLSFMRHWCSQKLKWVDCPVMKKAGHWMEERVKICS